SPPLGYEPNPYALLDASDFVFIDPVTTGFSRGVGENAPANEKDFHSVKSDIESVASFIRRYVSEHGCWHRPIYLMGESYGTFRAAGVARELFDSAGIEVAGIVLVSAVIDFGTIRRGNGFMSDITFFPALAATAHYHNRLTPDLQNTEVETVYRNAENFALDEYASALLRAGRLSDAERHDIATKIARYTGLDTEEVLRSDLRLAPWRFRKSLLRDEGQVIGRFDSRFAMDDGDDAGTNASFDPSYATVKSAYSVAFNVYLRQSLGYNPDLNYEVLTNVWPWGFGDLERGQDADLSPQLQSMLRQRPGFRVFIASGFYDLATPPMAVEQSIAQMYLPEEALERITTRIYEAGHMMYLDRKEHETLTHDLRSWYQPDEPEKSE
ncbi:MAG: peptidase S10, partial [Planctomycetota bacterium]